MLQTRPMLSLRERDRRWQALRQRMGERGLDCLLVGSFRSRERFESYLLDDQIEGMVLFPLEGAPVVLSWYTPRISRALESASRGVESWVTDYRVGGGATDLAALLRERGLDQRRIGIVGLGRTSPGEPDGYVPYTYWTQLLEQVPQATFVDFSADITTLVLVRSEEELALVRYAARVTEAACQAMLDVTRPGVGEELIYAAIMREIFAHGADVRYPFLSLQSGPHNIGWGPPRWLHRAEPARRVQRGDMVQAEIHTCYGGIEAQVQMSIALEPVDASNQRCEEVARRSYEAGLAALRPGMRFAELVHTMEAPLRASGCWAKTPLAHTFTVGATGFSGVHRDQLVGTDEGWIEGGDSRATISGSDLVLCPGMLLELEPNACLGTHRVNIGGGVVVTETGCEELNALPTRVHHL
jgi:Xaa-Pro aminopeptidase